MIWQRYCAQPRSVGELQLLDAHPLFGAGGILLPIRVISRSKLRESLRELESQRLVISHRGENEDMKWEITDNGLARLAELI